MTLSKIYRTVILGFCFLLSPIFSLAASDVVPIDKVVAIVNSSIITQNQLNETTQALTQQLQATGQPIPSEAVLRKKALDQAIGELLQLQVAQRAKITVSDADVTRAITQIAEQNNITADQLKEALEKQGISYKQYRTQIHDQMVMHQVQQQALGSKIQASEREIQAYLKKSPPSNDQTQYHLDDLLIPLTNVDDVSSATKQANELLQKARSGKNLNELAQGNIQYTDLQWRTLKDLPPIFADVIPNLKAGEVAGPIKAPNGLHILHLLEVRGEAKPLTATQAKQAVLQQKMQEQSEKWAQELRKTAYIKIM